jgi:hypothetical protein
VLSDFAQRRRAAFPLGEIGNERQNGSLSVGWVVTHRGPRITV